MQWLVLKRYHGQHAQMNEMYKNVVLIFPKHCFNSETDGFLPHPLGIEYIASSIEDSVEKVVVIDENCNELDFNELNELKPDLIGTSMQSYQYNTVIKLASRLKEKVSSNPKIVVGGFHPTLMPDEVLSNDCIDFVVRGEGELTMRDLVKEKKVEKILGLSFKKGNKIIHNLPRPFVKNLDKLPFPARHLRKHPEKYKIFGFPYASMMTSRGCPYHCSFCNAYNMHKGNWRSRSVQSIIEEIELVNERFKPKVFFFWDLDCLIDKKRLKKFCKMIKTRNIKIKFICMARVNSVLNCKDILPELKECGLSLVQIGLERPDDQSLEELNKEITIAQSKECVKALKESGIFAYSFFIVGLPEDNEQTFQACIDYANKLDLDALYFLDVLPLPETEFREEMEEKGFLRTKSWDYLHFGTNVNLKMKHMTFEEFDYYVKKYRFKYITQPKRLVNLLKWFYNTFKPNLFELIRSIFLAIVIVRNRNLTPPRDKPFWPINGFSVTDTTAHSLES